MYSRAAYVFLDDVLSAVDVHTAQHILEHCLLGPLAQGRTMIMVSHHAQLCAPHASRVLHLDHGRTLFVGTGVEYLETSFCTSAHLDSASAGGPGESPEHTSGTSTPALKSSKSSKYSGETLVASSDPNRGTTKTLIKAETRVSSKTMLYLALTS